MLRLEDAPVANPGATRVRVIRTIDPPSEQRKSLLNSEERGASISIKRFVEVILGNLDDQERICQTLRCDQDVSFPACCCTVV